MRKTGSYDATLPAPSSKRRRADPFWSLDCANGYKEVGGVAQ